MKLRQKYNSAYGELEHDLRRDIYRRQLLPGEKLSSEFALARKYRISRNTVRKALVSLEAEGLITRVRGSGTFVSEKCPEMRQHTFSPQIRNRQILFLSFSTAFSEETLRMEDTFGPLYDGLSRVLNAYRYNLLIGHVNTTWEPPACLLNGDVAGIVFHGRVRKDFREKYMSGLPCVGLQHIDPEFDCSWVCIDNYQRSFLAVRHLYELGHRKIAFFLRGAAPDSLEEKRLWGYRLAMRHFGLDCPDKYSIIAPYPRVNGELLPDAKPPDFSEDLQIFRAANRPSALIVPNHEQAFIRALEKSGLRVPRDVSLISARNVPYPVRDHCTYVCDRFEDVCAEGGRLMIELIEKGDDCDCKTILLKPKLYPGNTTIPFPGAKLQKTAENDLEIKL